MTREEAIDSLVYGMFANNSELIHDIFNDFEQQIKSLESERANMIKTHQEAIESYRKEIDTLELNYNVQADLAMTLSYELEAREIIIRDKNSLLEEITKPKTCDGCDAFGNCDIAPMVEDTGCGLYEPKES